MGKTNKELAAEITIALINANPKLISPTNGSVTPGFSLAIAQAVFQGMYDTIHSVKD
jgi:hypothetical protein